MNESYLDSIVEDLFGGERLPRGKQFKEISRCLVRKDHACGKFMGASKSCFIACPSTDEVEPLLSLISEKLVRIGIEPVIAIKERAYGQDIFCTKICGKIIESQFCLVILDDTMKRTESGEMNVPNPNVYYEYGLMTALNKHVIPLQREGQNLAFNIQTHDTIMYTPRNMSSELDTAFKDAVKVTQEARDDQQSEVNVSQRMISRCLEMKGYVKKGSNWMLSDALSDTIFSGYGSNERRDYLFLALVKHKGALENALTDMTVIRKRLESKLKELQEKVSSADAQIKEMEAEKDGQMVMVGISRLRSALASNMARSQNEREENVARIGLIENSKFAIILTPQAAEFRDKAIEQYENLDKRLPIPLYVGDLGGIQIADLRIDFKLPSL